MKVKLINFKCWGEKEIDFGNYKTTLMSGASGKGKSSILEGITWAIQGGTLPKNTIKKGHSKTKVILTFDDIIIERRNGDRKVKVNDKYEGDEAQAVIIKKFGKSFGDTAYMAQDNSSKTPFALLTPGQKSLFLQNMVYGDLNIIKYKKKIKELEDERENELKECQGSLKTVTEILETTRKPELIPFPIKCKEDDIPKIIREKEKEVGILKVDINDDEAEIDDLQDQYNHRIIYEKAVELKTEELNKKNDELNLVKNELSIVDIKKEKKERDSYKSNLLLVKKRDIYNSLVNEKNKVSKQYQEILKKDNTEREEKIKTLEKQLWDEENEQETRKSIEENKDILKLLKQRDENLLEFNKIPEDLKQQISVKKADIIIIEEKIDEIKSKMQKLEIQSHSYSCPSCSENLYFDDEMLKKIDNNFNKNCDKKSLIREQKQLKKDREELQDELKILEFRYKDKKRLKRKIDEIAEQFDDEIIPVDELEDIISSQEEYLSQNLSRKKEIKKLKKQDNKTTLIILEKNIDELEEKINTYDKNDFVDVCDYDELNDKIFDKNSVIREYEINEKRKYTLETDIESIEENISILDLKITEKCFIRNSEDINDLLELNKAELETLKNDLENVYQVNQQIKLYKKNIEEFTAYNLLKDKVKTITEKNKSITRKVNNISNLKNLVKKAELKCFINILNNININVEKYIDAFFDEMPLSTTLKIQKEIKTKKGEMKDDIYLSISYNGMEDCDIKMLSGGEKQRLALAYTLAISELQKTPFILLDECTSHLDQNITGKIINSIKENYIGDNIIFIAHQVITGIFDNVIKF